MLTGRQQRILDIIVGDYIRTTLPIASDAIAQRHDLGVSSATIRNEVAQLEEQGYISRPHTSAGSVPLDKGYRTYVEAIDAASSSAEASAAHTYVRSRLMEAEQDLDNWATVAAQVLARMVGNLGLATFPKAPESKVKYLELVYLQEFLTMLIVVMEQARLRKHLIRLAEPISPTQAEMAGNRVRNQLIGMTGHEIGQLDGADLSPLEEEMVEATALILDEEDDRGYSDHYLDGLRNLLAQPEFESADRSRAVVNGVEDGSLVEAILGETPAGNTVRVVIGREHDGVLLWPMSVVLAHYGTPGKAQGVVGAVGPTRMEYLGTIASVRLLSSVMSEQLETVHGA